VGPTGNGKRHLSDRECRMRVTSDTFCPQGLRLPIGMGDGVTP